MGAFSRKTALLLARAGALLLAIGTVSWFVWNAQVRAQPADTPAVGTPLPEEGLELSPEELEELLLHSSKSFSPTDIQIKKEELFKFRQQVVPPTPTAADPYLPSTKSLFAGGALPRPAGEDPRPPPAAKPSETDPAEKGQVAKKGDVKKPAPKKTGAWLPSSKSLPPQEIPLPGTGK